MTIKNQCIEKLGRRDRNYVHGAVDIVFKLQQEERRGDSGDLITHPDPYRDIGHHVCSGHIGGECKTNTVLYYIGLLAK